MEVDRNDPTVVRKLDAARTRLVLDRPFLGALVLQLPLVERADCSSMATDARAIYYNAGYVAGLSFEHAQFMLAHTALHCGLGHFARRGARLRTRWDLACDHAVNQLLVDDGLNAPTGACIDARYRGLSAEEIYPLLEDFRERDLLDEHWFGSGDRARGAALQPIESRPNEGAAAQDDRFLAAHRDGFEEIAARVPAARRALAAEWESRLVATAFEVGQAGRLGAHWRALIAEGSRPRLPWRVLLARFLALMAREDYSFHRPSRREGSALLPGTASARVDLAVAVDTSGSIGCEQLLEFLAEIDALKGQLSARVTLLACDARIAAGSPWVFEPWDRIDLPEDLAGGGSTRFTPVFEWIAQSSARPDALVYFTDALGEFPASAPGYPVLWLVHGNAPVPWGERVQLI